MQQTTPKFRLLPVLIIVAMLAFSVRLVEFAGGVKSLSGSALAESAPAAHADEENMPDSAALEAPEHADKAGDEHGDGPKEMNGEHAADETGEETPWRDSGYDDLEYSPITREVFEDMVERRKKLEARERELQTREALFQAAEQELDRKYQELSTLREEIEGLLQKQSEEEMGRIASLVKIYEGMKPKEAARIFDTLDMDILVTVMSRMSERRLSPILANMNPERARTITIMLAEEKQLPTLPMGN